MFWLTRIIPINVQRTIMGIWGSWWNTMSNLEESKIWLSIIGWSLVVPMIIRYVVFKIFLGIINRLSLKALILTNMLFYVFLFLVIISLGPYFQSKLLLLIALQTGIEYLIWNKCSKDKKGVRLVLASVLSIILSLVSVVLIVVFNFLTRMTLEGMW